MPPFDSASSEQIRDRYKIDLQLLDDVVQMCDRLGATTSGLQLSEISRVQFVVLFHFVKALKSGRAIRLLFSSGFGEDAEMLLRVLVEQAILIRWIHKDESDERARAYALYLRHKQYQILSVIKKVMPDLELPGVSIADIEKSHEEYQSKRSSNGVVPIHSLIG